MCACVRACVSVCVRMRMLMRLKSDLRFISLIQVIEWEERLLSGLFQVI